MNAVCCRLCGYNSSELVAIFGEQGLAAEYARKIGRYLYLLVTPADDLPKALCWMCTEQLDSFHRFHQKINEIQQRTLKDRYLEFVIEAHHRFVEEGEIEIVEHNAVDEEEDDVPPSKSGAPLEEAIEEVQVIESHVEEEEEGGEADELTVRLIPDGTEENSFLVVKTESEAVVVEETQVQENRQIPSVDASQVEVFEIRKSSRKRRSKTEGANDDEEDIMLQQKTPRRRSRQLQPTPKNRLAASTSNAKQDSPSQKVSGRQQGGILADHDEYYEETNEGESGDEFPARDSDNEEWPAAETMDKFPTTLIRDGLLVVKGTLLMDMINREERHPVNN